MARKFQLRDILDGPVAKTLWAPSREPKFRFLVRKLGSHMQQLGHGAAKYIDKIIIK